MPSGARARWERRTPDASPPHAGSLVASTARTRHGGTGDEPRLASRLRLDWWWIAILAICAAFQIYRGAPVDGAFFLAAGAALLADAAGLLTALDRYPLPRVHLAAQIALGAVAVAVVTFAPQFGVADAVVVCAIGATAMILAWRDDTPVSEHVPNRAERPRDGLGRTVRRSAVLWASAGVFLCLWELSSFFLAMPSPAAEFEHPPLSDLLEPLIANPVGRAVCAALWVITGAALLRRGRGRE